MQLTTAFTLLTSVLASVPAAALSPRDPGGTFALLALRPGEPFNEQFVTASQSGLWLSRPASERDEQCSSGQKNDGAILYLDSDELDKFTLSTVSPGGPYEVSVFAGNSSLWLSVPSRERDAQCEGAPGDRPAVFFIEDEQLFLYTREGDDPQQFSVVYLTDRPHNLRYFSNITSIPEDDRGETTGWSVSPDSAIQFSGQGLAACSEGNGKYRLGVALQNGIGPNCTEIHTEVATAPAPVACKYSEL
ncbi:hypothetical protein B0J18DRAFT_464574 [Chaetomium sp. MPI-SDFR-AT-0129]|nr:hypothetical protein B0J18DRAFT_464574 [Chaetomium sp. MPI-SDFR-AT-0129]